MSVFSGGTIAATGPAVKSWSPTTFQSAAFTAICTGVPR